MPGSGAVTRPFSRSMGAGVGSGFAGFGDSLGAGAWLQLTDFDAQPTNRVITVTNNLPNGASQRFYRVRTPRLQ